ncbi:hypothetical protein KSP40_PGU020972 [Platanthera guangdongensis]|uniref:Uncharacterized protein n=1 Tax=Platanthera guangdongensis TaxID=2320717 RepID=A0ABR2N335_9ASPA
MSKKYAGDGHLRPPHAQGHHQLAGPSSSSGPILQLRFLLLPLLLPPLIAFTLLLFLFIFFFRSDLTSPDFKLQHVDVGYLLIEPYEVCGCAGGMAPPSSAVYLSLNITLRFSWANLTRSY